MKNYFDKYIKYKLKYLKIKNQQFGGETYDCSDKKITEVICEQNPDGQWNNKEECEKSKICIENNKLINNNNPSNESIMILRKNKKLLEEYGVYKDGTDVLPVDSYILKLKLEIINLIKKTKDFLKLHSLYDANDLKDILQNNYLYREEELRKIGLNLQAISLINENPILNKYTEYRDYFFLKDVWNTNKIYKDINDIKEFHDSCNQTEIPGTFHISGLIIFAVYKDTYTNKIIYLLGEQHDLEGTCNSPLPENFAPVYTASEFFNKLLNYFVKDKTRNSNNKLDIFLEEFYDPLNLNSKFKNYYPFIDGKGFLNKTLSELYSKHCKPGSIKKNDQIKKRDEINAKREEWTSRKKQHKLNQDFDTNYNICLYEPYVRFHHSDLRDISDKFTQYMSDIFWLYEDSITYDIFEKKYSNEYNQINLLELFNTSQFLKKIYKQIKQIIPDDLYEYFLSKIEEFKSKCISLIRSEKINYDYIKQNFYRKDDIYITEKNNVSDIFCDIMDLYIMTRIYRSFVIDEEATYESTNIMIYAGDYHIQNYIKHFEELGLQPMYMFTAPDTNEYACIRVNDFNMEYI